MTSGNRLPEPFGTRIDRHGTVTFGFEGRTYCGVPGDTIASALMANGRYVLSRSFKYHRPRGVLTMAAQDSNALVQVGHEPNAFADTRPITDGMSVSGQNYVGSLDDDRYAILGRLSRFLPVGFYYRTFWGPTKNTFVRFWEPMIRKAAGLGRISLDTPHVRYDKVHRFCDVIVVGGGPAGLSAALGAANAGAEVMLVEEGPELGGSLGYRREAADTGTARSLIADVCAHENIAIHTDATCNGWYGDNWLPVIQGARLFKVRAKQVVVAAGRFEQPVVFRNNDLPGIMLGTAAQRLMRLYAVKPGKRAVVLTCNAEGYEVAADLRDAGVDVAAIVDANARASGEAPNGVRVVTGSGISEADGGAKNWHVGRVKVSAIDGQTYAPGGAWIDCDLVCVAGGYMPVYQLPLQAGARLDYDDATAAFRIRGVPANMHLAGAANGATTLIDAMADGASAGRRATAALSGRAAGDDAPPAASPPGNYDWPLTSHPDGKDFVDFDEDLQIRDIENAIAEGYSELELVKRFSTVGMGPSQGRHAALTTSRIVARQTGRDVATVGVTTARPPFTAENLGVLAGTQHTQYRRTPMHFRHVEAGAQMQPVGAWWRPSYYGAPAERERLIVEEVNAVRTGVGMLDVSTLGSLEVRGPEAAAFLNRLYTMTYDTLAVGRIRYLLLANEMGSLIDDGVTYRMADDHFYVTSTTGAVGAIYQLMLYMNAQWGMKVDVLNATAVFAGINVTGPMARALLERASDSRASDDIDFGAEAFPYLHGRTGRVAGQPVRVMRIGFTGELSYEVHVPYSRGEALWDALCAAGRDLGVRPYGLEASRILRLEKGHFILGQDTDAMTTPDQIGMAWAVSKKKDDFLGKRSIEQRRKLGMDRKLVGFSTDDKTAAIAESCLVLAGATATGFVTSTCWSPTVGKRIGLAYAPPGTDVGDSISIRTRAGGTVSVPVVSPHFYDPENRRQEL